MFSFCDKLFGLVIKDIEAMDSSILKGEQSSGKKQKVPDQITASSTKDRHSSGCIQLSSNMPDSLLIRGTISQQLAFSLSSVRTYYLSQVPSLIVMTCSFFAD